MSERLKSVGLDIGTTTTQLIVSELEVENLAGSFSVPQMQIIGRKILYKSPVHFTPLLDESHVDATELKKIVEAEYRRAGVERHQVDTGAVIITGETSRKENAQAALKALAEFAGDFVVTTAGPDLESILAAKGAGADAYSEKTGQTLLHMDIGGGTSNLALIRDGEILSTGCLNVGGRLIKLDRQGRITYVSPVLQEICPLQVGDTPTREQLEAVADTLVQALEMAAGLRAPTELLSRLTTEGTSMEIPTEPVCLSFSGGVADCIDTVRDFLAFGDMGPVLGQKIRASRLCADRYRLGSETIRATVIGAGCHSTQLSGSTVFYRNVVFPVKNLPVEMLTENQWNLPADAFAAHIREREKRHDGKVLWYLTGILPESYGELRALGEKLARGMGNMALLALEKDMAKALGQAVALSLPKNAPCLCVDGLHLNGDSFLDIGVPVGPAIPVVIKTLIFSH